MKTYEFKPSSIISEVGLTLEKFPSARHFASWLGLCPDNRVSGGTVLGTRTRDVPSRAAHIGCDRFLM